VAVAQNRDMRVWREMIGSRDVAGDRAGGVEVMSAVEVQLGRSARCRGEPGERVLAVLCTASFLSALTSSRPHVLPRDRGRPGDVVPLLGQATTLMILVSVVCGIVSGRWRTATASAGRWWSGCCAIAVNLIGRGCAPATRAAWTVARGRLADAGSRAAAGGGRQPVQRDAQRRAMTWIIGSMSIARRSASPR
jgi:hypothetical protein